MTTVLVTERTPIGPLIATNPKVGIIVPAAVLGLGTDGALPPDSERVLSERIATLTRMQLVVLGYLTSGLLNKEIAASCGIQESTVKAHVIQILKRLRMRSRTEAAVKFAVLLDRYQRRADFPIAGPRLEDRTIAGDLGERRRKLASAQGI